MKRRLCTLATTAVLALAVQFGVISPASAEEPSSTATTTAPTTKSKPAVKSSPEMTPMRRIHGPW